MKIGILTQPLHANYGGLLQNYALQQVLIHAGHEVETLDWDLPVNLHSRLYKLKLTVLSKVRPSKYTKPRYELTKAEREVIWRNTNHFIQKYIHHTKAVKSAVGFRNLHNSNKYDAYVVGSDQCWRPSYNSFIYEMFLNFVKDENVKRISYAASFGTDKWEFNQNETLQCSELAKLFDLVTVREDSGVGLCEKFLGVKSEHVLDPTLLLTKEDYTHLITQENEPKSKGTLFNYILDPNDKKVAFIKNVSAGLGLTPFQVLPKCQAENRTKDDVKNRIEDCVFPGVTTWLRAFMDAEMTIVDSFHGMVFSIIFNKPFWVLANKERGNARFTSLLKLFGLENRLIDNVASESIDYSLPIDWNKVNTILSLKREYCNNLLLSTIADE